jgi:hypothetical protein
MLTGDFVLVFDNGEEITTNAHETLYTSYALDFFREYPNTPLLPHHHIQSIIGNGRLGSDSHLQILGTCMWSVYDCYVAAYVNNGGNETDFRDSLAEKIYQLTNLIYNDLSYRLEDYVVSLDITDFINVVNQPDIKNANDTVQATQQSIDHTYTVIKDALINSEELRDNPISLASRSKLVNVNQVLQCIAPRGYLTDTDSCLFPVPVLRGYVQGLRSFHDSFIESRSAAKSLIFSKTPLQQAEYFSRRLQLMSQIVQHLHSGDCGSTIYLLWKVRGPTIENGAVKRAGDLKQLAGKFYMDSDDKLKIIHGDDHDLVGRTLKIRSVIHCCHPDPYGICSTCFGELSLSVPANTNIGQMCCTSLAQKSSQNVLSVKHLDGSSVVDGIILSESEQQYLKVAIDDNSYMLADHLKGQHIQIVICAEQATNITDIMEVANVETLNITRVSELAEIGFRVIADGVTHTETIDVSLNGRLASMTYPLLKYIRAHGWGIDACGNYTISMDDWDWKSTILTLPLKHFNMSDHSADIAKMLESSVDKLQERDNNVSADTALMELFDLVNDKLTVNLAVLDVVLYSTMIVSAEEGNYGLPKPWGDSGLGIMRASMANRSLSAAMAYEGHREVIVDPNSYIRTNRTEHIFDRLLTWYD